MQCTRVVASKPHSAGGVLLGDAVRTPRHLNLLSGRYFLQAVMLVADKDSSFEITGLGDVIAPHDGIMAVGSGGGFARG